ncbi:(SSF, Peter Pan) family member protein, putative [Theileria annulata]|uniref:(SSF, Peter Pan) family member protein, putative n=1 Tax=Theileria annulata TaxID=5874 RepID=Q4UEE3_THEAN|nr:(SSF, Peter Pan) family member protein, putative [Theileria annulata]CAI74546.1 (SSF, Peter Pan) family member protein, putative [Theileria annulata]|eukprot:XP_952278.1 (SSF, Peter Pan) family member protein, putative [Theileria annulata]
MGKSRKKKSKPSPDHTIDTESPRILVIRRGSVNHEMKQLAQNLRLILSPNCAARLKEGSRQRLRDFTSVTDVLGLTHLIVLSQGSEISYLKIANLPSGPSFTFQINKISLISDIFKHCKNPQSFDSSNYSPLLVLNGFSRGTSKGSDDDGSKDDSSRFDKAMTRVTETLNKMISPVDLSTTKIQNCKRVILFHKQNDGTIVLRHYSINLVDCNTPDQVKDLLTRKTMKNLINETSDFEHINNYLSSDLTSKKNSSFDSDTDEFVELDNILSQNIIAKNKYGVDLERTETSDARNKIGISWRMMFSRDQVRYIALKMFLVKYHRFVKKTQEELEENKKLEPEIVKKRKLESERVMKIYEKYVKKAKGATDKEGSENQDPEKEDSVNEQKRSKEKKRKK